MDTVSETAAEPRRPTLLIVDDEEGPRQSLRIVFKNEFDVLLANNGPDAIQIARDQPIDVAVCDIMMSGMSGVDVLKELKKIDPATQVVMLTAFETIETARQALRYGASDYLDKPFDIPTMRAAVNRASEKHRTAVVFKSFNGQLLDLQRTIKDQCVHAEMARVEGEIYASVLHDINSPLTVISGFIELINRSMENSASLEGEQLAQIKGDLSNLTGQVGRCFEISRRYLSFLHQSPTENAPVAINQIISDVKELLMRHPSARGHQISVSGLEIDAFADINGTDLLQIMLNLTINALQSTDAPHRVELKCEIHRRALDLAAYPDGPQQRFINRDGFANLAPILAISISDDGPGIPEPILALMFEEKFTTKPPSRGTGLGLSIVKRLTVGANGAIFAQTKPGAGSTFTVFVQTQ